MSGSSEALELPVGCVVRAGQQWLLCGDRVNRDTVVHFDAQGSEMGRYQICGTMVVGRAAPDITLDDADTTLSRRHLSLSLKDSRLILRDLNSANGTLIKVDTPIPLHDGAGIVIGQQMLRFDTDTARPAHRFSKVQMPACQRRSMRAEGRPLAAPATAVATPAAAGARVAAGPCVTFDNTGASVPVDASQTICELAERLGVSIVADCHQGICGSDPIRIVSGTENLTDLPATERSTARGHLLARTWTASLGLFGTGERAGRGASDFLKLLTRKLCPF